MLFFDGKYHGHFDEALVELGRRPARARGGRAPARRRPRGRLIVPFNDLDALERALGDRDVAIVITEPALTNNVGLLMPDDGFHAGLRELTRRPAPCWPTTRRTRRSSGPAG